MKNVSLSHLLWRRKLARNLYFSIWHKEEHPEFVVHGVSESNTKVIIYSGIPFLGTQEEAIERRSGVYRLGLDPK
jgi:hypothetical protein